MGGGGWNRHRTKKGSIVSGTLERLCERDGTNMTNLLREMLQRLIIIKHFLTMLLHALNT